MTLIEAKARYGAMSETMKANVVRTFILQEEGYSWTQVQEKLKLPDSVVHVCFDVIRNVATSNMLESEDFAKVIVIHAKELGTTQSVSDDSFANQYDYHENI